MAAPRKKWSTTTTVYNRTRHESKLAAYRWVQRRGEEFRAGMLRADLTSVSVWVDEGRGWQLYETIRLADLAATTKEN